MSHSKPTAVGVPVATKFSLHTSQAASEFDINHASWVKFDRHLSHEIAQLEKQFERYVVRPTVRQSFGR
jgi:hypothetical protein